MLAIPCEQHIYFCPLQGQPLKYNIEKDVWSEYVPVENHSAVQVGLSQSSQNKPQYQVYLEQLEKTYAYFKSIAQGVHIVLYGVGRPSRYLPALSPNE